MKKVFKENGTLTARFGANSVAQIQEWLGEVDINYALNFATKIDNCPVFGSAISFPCEIEDQ